MELIQWEDITCEIASLRTEVFVEEQGFPKEAELEPNENEYFHFGLKLNSLLVGYVRVKLFDDHAHFSRILVKKAYRHQGYGSIIVHYAETSVQKQGLDLITLEAQAQAIDFYLKNGYHQEEKPLYEYGVLHYLMWKKVEKMKWVYETNRISLWDQDRILAYVTFPMVEEGTVCITHTVVDESLRGKKIASELLTKTAEVLSKTNQKAILECSYAKAWFEKNPQYQYLLKKEK